MRSVNDCIVLPQGNENFPSDLSQAGWNNLLCVKCLQMVKPIVVGFCSTGM